jgi:hypothetical protein
MKKIFTLAAAVLASFSLWAATESNPTEVPAKDNAIVGVSYTIAATYNAGPSGTKVAPMPDKGVKFRLNRISGSLTNAIEFTINEGHVINGITLVGVTNTDNKAATLGSIYVDGTAWNGTFETTLAAKNASAASTIEISGIAAEQSVVFVFSDLNGTSQANICYTVTYDEGPAKQVISTTEELINAKVNGVALDPNFLSELIDTKSVEVLNAYTTAPTVTFTKHVVITYDDESTKESNVDVEVVAEALGSNQWTANITLNGADTYSITMQRAAAYTVTYKMIEGSDEIVLGTELVAVGEHPAEYAQYEVRPLCTFNGWYDEDYLEEVDMTQVVVNSDTSFYADFEKAFASSMNFEQLVLDNGKKYDIKSALTAAGYDFDITELDSLNDEKSKRNEPYLGLKLKKQGSYVACNVLPGTTIKVKFGHISDSIKVSGFGASQILHAVNNELPVLSFIAPSESLIKIETMNKNTVMIKQIMINEEIADVVLPAQTKFEAACGTVENGTITLGSDKKNKVYVAAGETVVINVTPAEGYKVASVTAGNEAVVPVDGVYSFTMPAEDVTITASFSSTEGFENIDASKQAVKVILNGQLYIKKGDMLFNALGTMVK